jgi:t-SNARE complex subunit (syntaxin)
MAVATVIGFGVGTNVGRQTILRQRMGASPTITVRLESNGEDMGPSITSRPKTRPQKITWWCVFSAIMTFIVYVVVENVFFS